MTRYLFGANLFRQMSRPFAEKSDSFWEEVERCLNAGNVNFAANRLYYSLFLSVYEYAIKRAGTEIFETEVHKKMMDMVGRIIDQKKRNTFGLLKDCRITADYCPENVEIERLKSLIDPAREIRDHFISLTEKI